MGAIESIKQVGNDIGQGLANLKASAYTGVKDYSKVPMFSGEKQNIVPDGRDSIYLQANYSAFNG